MVSHRAFGDLIDRCRHALKLVVLAAHYNGGCQQERQITRSWKQKLIKEKGNALFVREAKYRDFTAKNLRYFTATLNAHKTSQ